MGMGRPSPYGQQGSFFGGGFSPMFSPMMQSPMYGGPGKGRYPMQPQGMPGGPGKGRSQDPFGRQTMQPQPFGQKGNNSPQPFFGNNPPPPPPQPGLETGMGEDRFDNVHAMPTQPNNISGYMDFYNNRNFQLKPVGNNPPPQLFQPAVDLSSKQRGGPRFGINMPPPPQATTGELPSLLQGPIRQEPMTGNQGFGNLQPMPYQPSFGQPMTQPAYSQPMPQPLSGVFGGSFGQLGPTNPMQYPQPQLPAFGVQPFYRDNRVPGQPVLQGGFTQGPMNMPQPARIMDQGPRPIMDRSAMHLAPQLASNPRYSRGLYGGGIMDLYPR